MLRPNCMSHLRLHKIPQNVRTLYNKLKNTTAQLNDALSINIILSLTEIYQTSDSEKRTTNSILVFLTMKVRLISTHNLK